MNPCEACGKDAGEDYRSLETSDDGIGVVLCDACCSHSETGIRRDIAGRDAIKGVIHLISRRIELAKARSAASRQRMCESGDDDLTEFAASIKAQRHTIQELQDLWLELDPDAEIP